MATDRSARRPPGNGDGDSESVDKLEGVELVSFTAEPSQIGPFGESTLKWEVQGVAQGVQVVLNNGPVPPSSQRMVRPPDTHGYTLAATAGSGSQVARKSLRTVTVHVDVSACAEAEMVGHIFEQMRLLLQNGVESDPETYWSNQDSRHLSVEAQDGRVVYHMLFRRHVDDAPDLWVDLWGSFGLGVADGQLVAIAPSARGSAEFPNWFEWIGGITVFLALAANDAGRKAAQAAWDRIDDLLSFLNVVVAPGPASDRQLQSARVYRDEDGDSVLAYRDCPK